jgi:hypothetical protein
VISAPGEHSLKLIATSDDGRENFQDLKSINLTGEGGAQEYDFVSLKALQVTRRARWCFNLKRQSL